VRLGEFFPRIGLALLHAEADAAAMLISRSRFSRRYFWHISQPY
jgi:hypothetical protein